MTSLVVRSYLPEDREALIALWDRVRPDDPVLVEAAEDGLRDLGCPKVNLQIRAKNAGIADFYRSSGYQVEELVSMGNILGGLPGQSHSPDGRDAR